MSHPKLAEVIAVLNQVYPEELAADWDSVGLVVGDLDATIDRALLVVDVTAETVAQAIDESVTLIIAHHPLLFRGVTSVAEITNKGSLITQLIKHNIALLTIHTNGDASLGGVSDALASVIGLSYDEVQAIEPETGIGRIGNLATPIPAAEFANQISQVLPQSNAPVRLAGNPDRIISRVAVCGGAGDSLLPTVVQLEVDAFVTSDLRHHVASEFVADTDCVLID
ncbi:MAG: Nif3-like dinuclear metal center hexameric protein, partial [Actinobacteria bacterium]|nr:Nif3-like dinuclear metal center hexameric protein [Actinomycetota bacterium]